MIQNLFENKCSFDWKVKFIVNQILHNQNPITSNNFHLGVCLCVQKDDVTQEVPYFSRDMTFHNEERYRV